MMLVPVFSASLVALAHLAPADPADPRIELLALDIEGVPADSFDRALQTRLPDRSRIPAGNPDARAGVEHWGYVLVRPVEGGWSLALILADGRGYYRHVASHDGGDAARLIASTLSNLIASVEEDALVADAQNVAVPDEQPATPKPQPEPEPEPPPNPSSQPTQPAEPSSPEAPPAPRDELGLTLRGVVQWPLGPPAPGGLAGGGAELSVSGRRHGGLVLGGSAGGLGRASAGYRLIRLRLAVFAGYGLRRGRFELVTAAGASAQPWFVRGPDGSEALRSGQQEGRSVSALWGGFVQTSPGLHLDAGATRLRLGPTIRLSGAATAQGGGGVARVLRQTEAGAEALFRLGGLELTTGLGVTVWWTPADPN
ncbi:MAG: hypothetical protein ACRBN8_11600 [Nannocystales bacterium]